MSESIHGSGLATQTAANLLRQYATDMPGIGPQQRDHIRFCVTQLEKDFMAVRHQRDAARNTAQRFEEELHRLESLYLALKEQGGVLA